MRQPSAVIFDCDGTLVDSEGIANQVLVEVLAEHGHQMQLAEALAAFRGGKMADCLSDIERRFDCRLPDDFEVELRRRTAAAFRTRLQPIDGALDLVRALPMSKCVASSGPRAKIELSLAVTGLLPYFVDRIFSSYEVGRWKPDPGLFLHAARAMGVEPSSCAVVEDSPPGIEAGLAAGMTVFALQSADADPTPPGVRVVHHLGELRRLLLPGA